jgi:gluconokinase
VRDRSAFLSIAGHAGSRIDVPSCLRPDQDTPLAIVVMGVSGSGKSTLRALLARELHAPFLEGDDFHDAVAVAKMRGGTPLTDADRWPWLDRLGAAARQVVTHSNAVVLACSALKRAYRDRLETAFEGPLRLILLDGDRTELARRLQARLEHYMPATLLDSQLATLQRLFPDEHALILHAAAAPEMLCSTALAWLSGEHLVAG